MIDKLLKTISAHGGLSKPNRFKVDFSGAIAKLGMSRDYADVSFLCESTSVPGRQLTTIDYSAWGHTSKVPTGFVEDDVEMVFSVTDDFLTKRFIEEWMAKSVDPISYILKYDSEYKADIDLYQLSDKVNENGEAKVIYAARLIDAYPYSMKGISFDSSAESSFTRFSCTFAHSRVQYDFKDGSRHTL